MERTKAIARLRKLLGPGVEVEVNDGALPGARRAEAVARLKLAHAEVDDLQRQMAARSAALRDADPEYGRLKAREAKARIRRQKLVTAAHLVKFVVGKTDRTIPSIPIFHHVAEGDTWEEVLAKVEAKKKKEGAA